ncbi:glycosyltransferase family 2 protein [Photobacterium sp. GSS17]|uniref:glycosyltransferase family 2 protein n=1 Tax=Photobacterium sp. GSS17 TaxID=3020715 RepID=UPI002361635D|nr:glycosyltransferase family 2 protein [Photobacterium sp. GSS17]
MNVPQVAVIIATKNRPNLLKQRALKSVLKQTRLPNFLIVVDDSSEQTQQKNRLIVESLPSSDYHIQYLINQRTHGASGSWNTAIDYLSSQYRKGHDSLFLAFLDDDDEWHPNYLESSLVAASSNHCNMVAAGFYRYESTEQRPIECLSPKSLNEDLFLRGNPGIQGSNLFLSLDTMLMVGGFDEHLPSCTDRDLCIRLCELEVIRYHSINEPLLNHYADSDRQRLSTPNSPAKKKGLAAFWQKYHGRMSNAQREAFLNRAQSLFNWKPEASSEIASEPAIQIALTLGIELGSISFSKLSQAIERIHQVGQQHLVGFNLVLTATQDLDLNELSAFLEFVRQQGITCYNLCAQQTCIETATAFVAKENIGHSAWVLRGWQPQGQPYCKNENVISALLTELGARQLCDDSLNELLKKQQTELVQEITQRRADEARARIDKLFCIDTDDLQLLGIGSEAIVMTDGKRVFKCIDYWKTRIPAEQIKFLQQDCSQWRYLPGLYTLDEVIVDGKTLVLTYPYEVSAPYQGGHCEQVINLLHSCSKAGIVCNNIHPKNLIKTQNEVKLIDYGSDIRPWNELGFEHMARRAYLTIYHAAHPCLKFLMRQSLHTTKMPEMDGYQAFRQRLTGIDCNLKQAQQVRLPLAPLAELPAPFALTIGVITGDAHKLLPLLNSIAELAQCGFLSEVSTIVLCNGCSDSSLTAVLEHSKRPLGNVRIITEAQQVEDSESGLFGSGLANRQRGLVGIAQARSMLQKYVGLKCEANPDSIAWILDDDMRLDARAKQYLPWLPKFKQEGIDVVIGQYEGSSPNPPLNGLRGQLVDLLHNLRWLDTLSSNIELPDRSDENTILRNTYPDYYYDLSRKHSAHVEVPFWLEPAYKGETVAEARARLFAYAPLLVTGFPLTRSIIPACSADPLMEMKDTVNRGGNTFVLNPKALTQTPNLIPKINGREARRSDMVWAMVNKHHHRLSIKSAPFPVQHTGRVKNEKILDLKKVQDEIMGSALYAGLQEFLLTKEEHNLVFTPAEITNVWKATRLARNTRLSRLKHSFYRINGLAQALSKFPELTELCEYLARSFNPATIAKLEAQVKQMNEHHICEFLNQIVPQSTSFANAHQKTVETIE